jgi:Putative S-adenosyl-L-methionine-dependent methyltransferase
MARRAHPESKDVFLPTSLLQLLRRIKQNIPKSHLVISDFDKLISPVSGINAPIVSKKGFKSEEKQDYSSYLVKRGEADIFFPVDFSMLQLMHDEVLGKESQVVKSFEFIQEFSSENWAQTRSNFNPIK